MNEEYRDSDLDLIRKEWQAPPPSPAFHHRMLDAFGAEFGRSPWWRHWIWPAAVAAAIPLVAFLISHSRATNRYEPVQQPHFIVLTAGEHP